MRGAVGYLAMRSRATPCPLPSCIYFHVQCHMCVFSLIYPFPLLFFCYSFIRLLIPVFIYLFVRLLIPFVTHFLIPLFRPLLIPLFIRLLIRFFFYVGLARGISVTLGGLHIIRFLCAFRHTHLFDSSPDSSSPGAPYSPLVFIRSEGRRSIVT